MWDFASFGLGLVFLGFALVVVALLKGSRSGSSEAKGAGVVMIGPVPVVFGSDAKWASVAIALAIVLVLLSALVYVL